MADTVTAWLVRLNIGDTTDIKGTLSLEADDVRFADEQGNEARIPMTRIREVRRLRMSPVILITHEGLEGPIHTAFYFVPPPSLEPVRSLTRMSMRRTKRKNTAYLSRGSVARKEEVKLWVGKIRGAVARAADARD